MGKSILSPNELERPRSHRSAVLLTFTHLVVIIYHVFLICRVFTLVNLVVVYSSG